MTTTWTISVAEAAQADIRRIVRFTRKTFGPNQAAEYRGTLLAALAALEAGPAVPGSSSLEAGLVGLRVLHVARYGRRGRHLLVYRPISSDAIEVLRVLHDQMDLLRHLDP